MTVAAVHANLLSATLYKSQLEFSIMQISQKRMNLAWQSAQLATADAESPAYRQLQAMDSYLEQQQKILETQQKAVTAQLESYQKLLDTNIQKEFKLNISA